MNLYRGVALSVAQPQHEAFVCKSFRESLIAFGGMSPERARLHRDALWHHIRSGIVTAVVASPLQHPETYCGWAASDAGALLFCYVPDFARGEGIARKTIAALFDCGPIRLVYWTDVAEAARDHGFPLVHDWREFRRRERLVDRAFAWRARQTTHSERAA